MTQHAPASRGSVIIPAWNEADVIARTLRSLRAGLERGIDVVVACNGCTDGTEEIARTTDPAATILSLGPVGKVGAIRAAEEVVGPGPKVYLDADIVLTGSAATAVVEQLRSGAVAARPPARYEVDGVAWPVRAFVRVRGELPSLRGALHGAGVYGLSEAARARFGQFPDVVADDLFAGRVVAADEVTIVDCDPVAVRVPRTTRALVHTLGRVYRGNQQLLASRPDLGVSTTSTTSGELAHLARSPRWWPAVATYVLLVSAGRVAARRAAGSWERDDSARLAVGRS